MVPVVPQSFRDDVKITSCHISFFTRHSWRGTLESLMAKTETFKHLQGPSCAHTHTLSNTHRHRKMQKKNTETASGGPKKMISVVITRYKQQTAIVYGLA